MYKHRALIMVMDFAKTTSLDSKEIKIEVNDDIKMTTQAGAIILIESNSPFHFSMKAIGLDGIAYAEVNDGVSEGVYLPCVCKQLFKRFLRDTFHVMKEPGLIDHGVIDGMTDEHMIALVEMNETGYDCFKLSKRQYLERRGQGNSNNSSTLKVF